MKKINKAIFTIILMSISSSAIIISFGLGEINNFTAGALMLLVSMLSLFTR